MTSSDPADPGDPGAVAEGPLRQLLELQQADTTIDQLRHRRANMPERLQRADAEHRRHELEGTLRALHARRQELVAAQTELERQIDGARARRQHIDQRMRSGQVSAARDLTAMDDEVRHLGAHVSGLEDREIEIMEELEPVDGEVAAVEAEDGRLLTAIEELSRALADAEASIDSDLAEADRRRHQLAGDLPAALLAQYERIRARSGGVGAARLVGSTCSGCHLELPSMEADRIRRSPPGTVTTCEQCGRILVR